MAITGVWNDEKQAYVSPAEAWGYKFDHTTDNIIAWNADGLDEWAKETAWEGFDIDKFIADHVELDYDRGTWHIDPDADPWDPAYEQVVMEELELSMLDGPITPEDCDGDTQWCDLVNALVEHEDNWGFCDELGNWLVMSESMDLEDVPDAVRAVRPVLNGYEAGGWFVLTSQG